MRESEELVPSKALSEQVQSRRVQVLHRCHSYKDLEDQEGGRSSAGTQGYEQSTEEETKAFLLSPYLKLFTWPQMTPAGSTLQMG